ncbi:hypothetical protein GQ42DRAFT_24949 [Ramicandelaber brevisporus]|nr:hypothetical protein GQ42DRAFT_24949 [Ramicandelaber brevisporus]
MTTTQPQLCSNGCGFFGSAAFKGMCSQCYRAAHPEPIPSSKVSPVDVTETSVLAQSSPSLASPGHNAATSEHTTTPQSPAGKPQQQPQPQPQQQQQQQQQQQPQQQQQAPKPAPIPVAQRISDLRRGSQLFGNIPSSAPTSTEDSESFLSTITQLGSSVTEDVPTTTTSTTVAAESTPSESATSTSTAAAMHVNPPDTSPTLPPGLASPRPRPAVISGLRSILEGAQQSASEPGSPASGPSTPGRLNRASQPGQSGQHQQAQQSNPGRCFYCRGKVPLVKQITNKCKCSFVYCDTHKQPQKHDCTFDYASYGKDILQRLNPKVAENKGGRSFQRLL